ncbi:hypothetical protein [uncultured Paraburkholderia sp.]|nr:hypothetical protein [uncultured Paraburkholderia sp.]
MQTLTRFLRDVDEVVTWPVGEAAVVITGRKVALHLGIAPH